MKKISFIIVSVVISPVFSGKKETQPESSSVGLKGNRKVLEAAGTWKVICFNYLITDDTSDYYPDQFQFVNDGSEVESYIGIGVLYFGKGDIQKEIQKKSDDDRTLKSVNGYNDFQVKLNSNFQMDEMSGIRKN